jgi:hypothetical protein
MLEARCLVDNRRNLTPQGCSAIAVFLAVINRWRPQSIPISRFGKAKDMKGRCDSFGDCGCNGFWVSCAATKAFSL